MPASEVSGSAGGIVSCQQCGQPYHVAELWGGLCEVCLEEASPPYLALVALVMDLRAEVERLGAEVKRLSRPAKGPERLW